MCRDCGEFECDKFEAAPVATPTFNPAYRVARCGDGAVHGPHIVDSGPDQPRNCPGKPVPPEPVVAEVPIEATPFGGESTSAALRRVEAERDQLRDDVAAAAALAGDYARERDVARTGLGVVNGELKEAREALRRLDEAAGRDIGKESEPLLDRVADLRRGREEATERVIELVKRVADLERQVAEALDAHGRTVDNVLADGWDRAAADLDAQAALVHTYPALYCRTCYSRILLDTPAAATHPHDLMPVTVTVTHRTEGAPTT